ncbi:hypothetical protein EI94DRAFT_1705147 [Lactarius quietus]|nr:hypothetical protein EI94DRAFT_1705147 [Lactarius quietus]
MCSSTSLEDLFKRFKVYSQSFLNTKLADVVVKIVVKILNILSIAKKEVEQSRAKRYITRLARRKGIENAMGELEKVIHVALWTRRILRLDVNWFPPMGPWQISPE